MLKLNAFAYQQPTYDGPIIEASIGDIIRKEDGSRVLIVDQEPITKSFIVLSESKNWKVFFDLDLKHSLMLNDRIVPIEERMYYCN